MSGHRRISTDLFLEERRKARLRGDVCSPIEALLELDLDAHRDAWPATGPPVKTYARLWGWTPSRARRLIERWKAYADDLYLAKNANPQRTPSEQNATPPANPQTVANSDGWTPSANPLTNPERTPDEPRAHPILEPEPEPEPKTKTAVDGGRVKSPSRKPGKPCPERLEAEDRDRVLAWIADPKNRSVSKPELDFAWKRFRAWATADDHRKRDWGRAFENALAEGWPLKGYGSDPRRSPEEARADRTKRAVRAAVLKVQTDGLRLVTGGTK